MTTYEKLIKDIMATAISHPNVNASATGSIYDLLNGGKAEQYKAVILTPRTVEIDDGMMTFNGILFCCDRETNDALDRFARQGESIATLHNILNTLRDENGYEIEQETYTVFSEKFTDVCAGAYVNLKITLPFGDCTELY